MKKETLSDLFSKKIIYITESDLSGYPDIDINRSPLLTFKLYPQLYALLP